MGGKVEQQRTQTYWLRLKEYQYYLKVYLISSAIEKPLQQEIMLPSIIGKKVALISEAIPSLPGSVSYLGLALSISFTSVLLQTQ